MASKVQVLEKNKGAKIAFSQKDVKLVFGDDDLAIRCDTRQRDYPVHVDVCADDDGNLILGAGRYYVAQVDIPPAVYVETEIEADETAEQTEVTGPDEPENGAIGMQSVQRERQPIDMSEVVVTLWSVDDFRPANM